MQATLEFNPAAYSERSLRLILARAQEWQCPPAEAVGRLLDELAARHRRKVEDAESLRAAFEAAAAAAAL